MYVIGIPESEKQFACECEIVGFGICDSTRGIWNPSNDWNLHSNCHGYGVQIALVKFSALPAKILT